MEDKEIKKEKELEKFENFKKQCFLLYFFAKNDSSATDRKKEALKILEAKVIEIHKSLEVWGYRTTCPFREERLKEIKNAKELNRIFEVYKYEMIYSLDNGRTMSEKCSSWITMEDYESINFTDDVFLSDIFSDLNSSSYKTNLKLFSFAKKNIICETLKKEVKSPSPFWPQECEVFKQKFLEAYENQIPSFAEKFFRNNCWETAFQSFCETIVSGDLEIKEVRGLWRYYTEIEAITWANFFDHTLHFVGDKDLYRKNNGYYKDPALEWIYKEIWWA